MKLFLALAFGTQLLFSATGFRAGTARADITPDLPVWLSGYAVRTHPANHITQRLWAKALAVEDGRGGRFVVVTIDLLGLPPELADDVAARCHSQFGLTRDQLWLNTSHTHSGPVVWPNLRIIFDFNAEEQLRAEAYARTIADHLVQIVGQSLKTTEPAYLAFGTGEAGFAINRRLDKLRTLNPGRNYPAPIDHSVPVIKVKNAAAKVMAVFFGYACHNTTITGEFYEVAGDYAGYAQARLEKDYPGAQAMFFMLCGGDQNPSPRSQLVYAETHGSELATAVEQVLAHRMTNLTPHIRTSFLRASLPLTPHTREDFEAELQSTDVYHQRRSRLVLQEYDRGAVVRNISLPVQAIRFGDGVTILTLGGEVVVDYALRAKREYARIPLVVAGYSNGVVSYIPSDRVLHEGGYEAVDSIVFYGLPAPYAPGVEDLLFATVRKTLSAVGIHAPHLAAE